MTQTSLSEYQSSGVECEHCGREFDNQMALNSHVGHSHDIPSEVDVECANCGDTKSVTRYSAKEQENHFCDHECKAEWQSEHVTGQNHPNYNSHTRDCDMCGETYEYPAHLEGETRFCSRECQLECVHTSENSPSGEDHPNWVGESETRSCEHCGENFTRRPYSTDVYCSIECAREGEGKKRSGENHPHWKGGVSKSLTEALRKFISNESWYSIRERHAGNQECSLCGVQSSELDRRLSLHHIVPLTTGGTNGDWNLMPVCEGCHRKVESFTENYVEQYLRPQ